VFQSSDHHRRNLTEPAIPRKRSGATCILRWKRAFLERIENQARLETRPEECTKRAVMTMFDTNLLRPGRLRGRPDLVQQFLELRVANSARRAAQARQNAPGDATVL
jgi:hypothetical protein